MNERDYLDPGTGKYVRTIRVHVYGPTFEEATKAAQYVVDRVGYMGDEICENEQTDGDVYRVSPTLQ